MAPAGPAAKWQLAKQICCIKDTFSNDDAIQRNLLHLKYLNESCLCLEKEPNLILLSVTLMDGTVILTSGHRNRCGSVMITLSTRICFVYRKYHIALTVDLNPSMFAVSLIPRIDADDASYGLPFDLVLPTLETIVRSLAQPLIVPVSDLCFSPSIYISVILIRGRKQHLAIQGVKIRRDDLEDIIQEIQSVLAVADVNMESEEPKNCSNFCENLSGAVTMLQYMDPSASPCLVYITNGVIPPLQFSAGDFTVENSLSSLANKDIPVHVLYLPILEELSGPLYTLSSPAIIQLTTAFTKGTHIDTFFLRQVHHELATKARTSTNRKITSKSRRKRDATPDCDLFYEVLTNDSSLLSNSCTIRLLIALLCRFSQVDEEHFQISNSKLATRRSTVKALFDDDGTSDIHSRETEDSTPFVSSKVFTNAIEPLVPKFQQKIQKFLDMDHAYPWHGQPAPVQIVVKDVMEYQLCVDWSDILPLRIKAGFEVKQLIYDTNVVCARLLFVYAPYVRLNYIIKASRHTKPPKSIVTLRISCPSDIIRDFLDTGINSLADQRTGQDMFRLHQMINSIQEVDRVTSRLRFASWESSKAETQREFATACLGIFAFESLERLGRYFYVHSLDLITLNDTGSIADQVLMSWSSYTVGASTDHIRHYFRYMTNPSGTSEDSEGLLRKPDVSFALIRLYKYSAFVKSLHLIFPHSSSSTARENSIDDLCMQLQNAYNGTIKIRAQGKKQIFDLCNIAVQDWATKPMSTHSNLASLGQNRVFRSVFSHNAWVWEVPELAAGHELVRMLVRSRVREKFLVTSTSPDMLSGGTYEPKGIGAAPSRVCYATFCKSIPRYDLDCKSDEGTTILQYKVSIVDDLHVMSEFWMEQCQSYYRNSDTGETINAKMLKSDIESHLERVDSTLAATCILCFIIHSPISTDQLTTCSFSTKHDEIKWSDGKFIVTENVADLLLNAPCEQATFPLFQTRCPSSNCNTGFFSIFKSVLCGMSDAVLEASKSEGGIPKLLFAKVLDHNTIFIVHIPNDMKSVLVDSNGSDWNQHRFMVSFLEIDTQSLTIPMRSVTSIAKHIFGYSKQTNKDVSRKEDAIAQRTTLKSDFVEQVKAAHFYSMARYMKTQFSMQLSQPTLGQNMNPEDIETILNDCPSSSMVVDMSLLRMTLLTNFSQHTDMVLHEPLKEIDQQFGAMLETCFKDIPDTSFYYFVPSLAQNFRESNFEDQSDSEPDDLEDSIFLEFETKQDIRKWRRRESSDSVVPEYSLRNSNVVGMRKGSAYLMENVDVDTSIALFCRIRGFACSKNSPKDHPQLFSSIVDGKISAAIRSTLDLVDYDQVGIVLQFSTLPQLPRMNDQQDGFNTNMEFQDSLLLDSIKKHIRNQVKAMVSNAVLRSLQQISPVTKENIALVQKLLYFGALPRNEVSTLTIKLSFVNHEMGPRIFGTIMQSSRLLPLLNVSDDLYCVVEPLDENFPDGTFHERYTIPYWAILRVGGDSVVVDFHHPPSASQEEVALILHNIRNGLLRMTKRANQFTLLQSLHDSRNASNLLIGDEKDLSQKVDGTAVSRPEDVLEFEHINASTPGRFACPCQHVDRFEVPERLHVSVAMHELRENALHPFVVTNFRDVFVYKDKEDQVFYLRLTEIADERVVILGIYGVDPPSSEMKGVLHSLLSSRITNATINAVARMLNRNPLFKLSTNDMEFLTHNHSQCHLSSEITIPSDIEDVVLLMLFYRQNLMHFVQQLHVAFSPSAIANFNGRSTKSEPTGLSRPDDIHSVHPAWRGYVRTEQSDDAAVVENAAERSPIFQTGFKPALKDNCFDSNDENLYSVEFKTSDMTFFYNSLKGTVDIGSGIGVSVVGLLDAEGNTISNLFTIDEFEMGDPITKFRQMKNISDFHPRTLTRCAMKNNSTFKVKIDLWNNGQINLPALLENHIFAFDRAVDDYRFESKYLERPLSLERDGQNLTHSSVEDLHALYEMMAKGGQSTSYESKVIQLISPSSLDDRLLLIKSISSYVAKLQPELCQLSMSDCDNNIQLFTPPETTDFGNKNSWTRPGRRLSLLATSRLFILTTDTGSEITQGVLSNTFQTCLSDQGVRLLSFSSGGVHLADAMKNAHISILKQQHDSDEVKHAPKTEKISSVPVSFSSSNSVTRRRNVCLHISVSKAAITISSYNWASAKLRALVRAIQLQTTWTSTRKDLLLQIQYQRMSLSFVSTLQHRSLKFLESQLIRSRGAKDRAAAAHLLKSVFESRTVPELLMNEMLNTEDQEKSKIEVVTAPPTRHDSLATARAAMESRKRGLSKAAFDLKERRMMLQHQSSTRSNVSSVEQASSTASYTSDTHALSTIRLLLDHRELLLSPGPFQMPLTKSTLQCEDTVRAYGVHALCETEKHRVESHRQISVGALIKRWTHEWSNPTQFAFITASQMQENAFSHCTKLEIDKLMYYSRLVYMVRTPVFLSGDSESHEHRYCNLLEFVVTQLVPATGMTRVLVSNRDSDSTPLEQYLQTVVNGMVVILHVDARKRNLIRCSLRIVEPNRHNAAMKSQHDNDDLFLLQQQSSHTASTPSYVQKLSSIRSQLNIVCLAYDYHIYFYYKSLLSAQDRDMAAAVFQFATEYSDTPLESRNIIYQQLFSFMIGSGLSPRHYSKVFGYVAERSRLYGISSLKFNNTSYLVLSSHSGDFSQPPVGSPSYWVLIKCLNTANTSTSAGETEQQHRNLELDVVISMVNNRRDIVIATTEPIELSAIDDKDVDYEDDLDFDTFALRRDDAQLDDSNTTLLPLEQAIDSLDICLHEIFSHAVTRYHRNMIWSVLESLHASSSIVEDINFSDILDLSLLCEIVDIDSSIQKYCTLSLDWSSLFDFLETHFSRLSIRNKEQSRNAIVLLPDLTQRGPNLSFFICLEVTLEGTLGTRMGFRNPLRSTTNITYSKLFVSYVVEKILCWIWSTISTF